MAYTLTPEQQARADEEYKKYSDSFGDNYMGKDKKAAWWNNYNQGVANQSNLDNIFSSDNQTFGINGSSPAEAAGRIEGLQRAKIYTGQNPLEIGADNKEAYDNIKKRTQLADTGSELLRANKAGAVADARNAFQAQGVKGGSAANAVSQIERAKSFDTNNQLADVQRKAEMDYMKAAKANANFTNEMEMGYGSAAIGESSRAPASYSNGFGSVICTELFLQGRLSKEIYYRDTLYGIQLRANKMHVYVGYITWAVYVVPFMRKSKVLTNMVAFFAIPWAQNMAGNKNLFGKVVSLVGEAGCGLLGKIISKLSGEKYVSNF